MLIVPETTARPTILPQRCRSKESLPKNATLRNSGQKKQNKPIARPPLHAAPSLLSPERPPAQIKEGSILRRKRRNGTKKTILRQLGITPTPWRLARRRNGTIEVTGGAIIARKRAIFRGIAWNLQITSVGLGNFRAGDWWGWGGCQGALHQLSDLIPGTPRVGRSKAGKGLAW